MNRFDFLKYFSLSLLLPSWLIKFFEKKPKYDYVNGNEFIFNETMIFGKRLEKDMPEEDRNKFYRYENEGKYYYIAITPQKII